MRKPPKRVRVHVIVDTQFLQAIREAAEKDGRSVGGYIRKVLRADLGYVASGTP